MYGFWPFSWGFGGVFWVSMFGDGASLHEGFWVVGIGFGGHFTTGDVAWFVVESYVLMSDMDLYGVSGAGDITPTFWT